MRQSDDPDLASSDTLPPSLPNDSLTLSDFFASAGYETYAGLGFPMPLFAVGGTFKKHRLYDDSTVGSNSDCTSVFSDYLSWLNKNLGSKTFSYLHLADLHSPVSPPEEYWRTHSVDESVDNITKWDYESGSESESAQHYRQHRKRLYRAAADYVDTELEGLINQIEKHINGNITTVITSDHGEMFWEHSEFDRDRFYDHREYYSIGHGGTPFEGVTRVSLLGRNISLTEGPMSLVDIAPTLLEAIGVSPPAAMSGHTLQYQASDDRILLTEASRYGYEKKIRLC